MRVSVCLCITIHAIPGIQVHTRDIGHLCVIWAIDVFDMGYRCVCDMSNAYEYEVNLIDSLE